MEMLKSTIQDMEKERDFYFGKLRNIELICQEKEGEEDPTLNRIIDILYATDVSSSLSSCLFLRSYLILKLLFQLFFMIIINIPAPEALSSRAPWLSAAEPGLGKAFAEVECFELW